MTSLVASFLLAFGLLLFAFASLPCAAINSPVSLEARARERQRPTELG